jgi:DNA-binding response OmpR family regulator
MQYKPWRMKIFIIDWTDEGESLLTLYCRSFGHETEAEYRDGGEAYRKSGQFLPDLILVNYGIKPSHGRITVESIKKRRATSSIPVYFLNGKEEDLQKIKSLGIAIDQEDLSRMLKKAKYGERERGTI